MDKLDKYYRRVFLGGTCSDSTWREELISMLEIEYYNPVVKNWTPECMEEEIKQRKLCNYVLYVITPLMQGVYSIAEVVDDSNKRPDKTIFCVIENDWEGVEFGMSYVREDVKFTKGQLKSLNQVKKMVKENGATVCDNLQDVADFLNKD